MHLNIKSIPSNLTKLVQYPSNLNVIFDIIGISETWRNETNKYIYNLNDYNHIPLVRPDRIHGGVSLFISASISYRILNEISIVNKDIECIFIEIELNGDKIHVGIIYRTPDADVRNVCDYLVNVLDSLKPHNQSCYIMEDYNIDLLKLYEISMKYYTSFNKITYTQYKDELTTILRTTEKEYYKCLLETNKNNLKKTWSIIRSVINNCKPSKLNESFLSTISVITDKNEVSDKFNDYFVNVGKTLAAQIPKSGPSFHKYLPEANEECISLIPTDEREIRNIILDIRNCAPGYDGISLKWIYPVIDTLVMPLTYITNLSLIEGIFPSKLKIAQVLPNYRPISLLPFLSKLFERLMCNRLIDFIEKHHLLYRFQFGFRKNHSTFMALLS